MKVIVGYSEIGTKSGYVQDKMLHVLRQRIVDRLDYEEIAFSKVSRINGRIVAETEDSDRAFDAVSEVPGVKWAAEAVETERSIEAIKQTSERFEYGETFGVNANRSADFELDSQEIGIQLGAFIEEHEGISVDLDDPDTWLNVEIRTDRVFVYTDRIEGPGGLPVGTAGKALAMISGGIDSPVAAFEMMKRGVDITPIYFYNKPISAEDHWLRLQAAVEKLKRFHPGKDWEIYRVNMDDVNQVLLDEVEHGRMIIHRQLMFEVSSRIAEENGFEAVVTGESLGQKSSQTLQNLRTTAKPEIFRPLLTRNKAEIVEAAREIDTFENASIDSACRSLSPDSPATRLSEDELSEMKEQIDFDDLVEKALENTEIFN